MSQRTAAVPRFCKCCGGEIAWQEATWVMNRGGRVEYYHAGCDIPHGFAELSANSSLTPDKREIA